MSSNTDVEQLAKEVGTDIAQMQQQVNDIASQVNGRDVSVFDTSQSDLTPSLFLQQEIPVTKYKPSPNIDNVRGFYKLVRQFVLSVKPWDHEGVIRYHSKPDERYNLPLVSYRVYGNYEEFIAVMASAGLDSVENRLDEQMLVLPSLAQLHALKSRSGFQNEYMKRA